MLQIKNLTITHSKDLRAIVENFTFSLNSGDIAVIIGEEGNGKSTLLKLLYNPRLIEDYAEFTGEIQASGVNAGFLAQELPDDILNTSVYEYFSSLPSFFGLSPQEQAETARCFGLTSDFYYLEQKIGSLSGGEKVKLQLMALLIEKPNVLLLDEPSNDIDIETLEWLEKFINNSSVPVIFVSHDETLIENTANVIIHIEQVRRKTVPRVTVARLSYADYISERSGRLEKQTQVALKEKAEYDKQQERFRQIFQRVEHDQNAVSRQDPSTGRLLKKKMKSVKSMERRFEKEKENMTKVPDIEEAIMPHFTSYNEIPDGKIVLDFKLDSLMCGERLLAENIELFIKGPQKICITGKNGSGKTTLIKKIAEKMLERNDIKTAYMPQNYEELFEAETGKTPPEFLTPDLKKESLTRARTFLGSMKYTADEMSHSIGMLSGGQKAKLLFLKMILDGANVLILDEPTRNFSPLSNPVIREILKEFKGTIISVSHDRKYINDVCGNVYRLERGGLIKEKVEF